MKTTTWLLASTAALVLSCSPQQKSDPRGSASGKSNANAGMDPGELVGMRRASAPNTLPRPVADATRVIAQIIAKSQAQAKLMQDVQSLDDLRKSKAAYIQVTLEILRLTIQTLKMAVKLPPEQLKAYAIRSTTMNAANMKLAKRMVEVQKRILKIKGARGYFTALQKELATKITPLIKQMGALNQEYANKTRALTPGGESRPRPAAPRH